MKRNQLQLSFSVDEDASSISDLGSTVGDDEADGQGEFCNVVISSAGRLALNLFM